MAVELDVHGSLTPTDVVDDLGPDADPRLSLTEKGQAFSWMAATLGDPHQVAGSAWRRGHGEDGMLHLSCAFEMGLGTGKTLLAIEEILKLKAQQPDAEVLVLAPNSVLRTVWEKQFEQHAPGRLDVAVLDGPTRRRKERLERERHDVWVHNHESLAMMGTDLAAHGFRMIVIDEHSKFRSPQSSRSQVLLGRGKWRRSPLTAKYRIAMSGTPVIKKASDVYTTYKWIGAPFGTHAQFKERYAIIGPFGSEVGTNPRTKRELLQTLDKYRFVVPRSYVNRTKPSFEIHEVELPDWQRAIYTRVQEQLRTEFEDEFAVIVNPLTQYLRLAQVTAGFEAIDRDRYKWRDDNAKAAYLLGPRQKDGCLGDSLLKDLMEEDDKIIVWAWYQAEIRELSRMMQERGVRAVTFFGGNSHGVNDAAVRAFQEGDAQVFIGQSAAAGLGLNLGASRTAVYYTRSFDTEAYYQSLMRNIRRDGVAGQRVVPIVQARDTIDAYIHEVLARDTNHAAALSSIDPAEVLGRPVKIRARMPGQRRVADVLRSEQDLEGLLRSSR